MMKNKCESLLLFFICALSSTTCMAQPATIGEEKIAIYILMGQSNMAGRGVITEAYRNESNPKVVMLNKRLEWVTAKHPLHFDKPIAGVGPGLQFGVSMAAANQERIIGLVPAAVGGTSITTWKAGAFDSATKTHPYDDAIARIKAGMKKGTIEGVLWLQGESDVATLSKKEYLAAFKKLVQDIRMLTNNPSLPFVIGELGQFKITYQQFNKKVIKKIPRKIKRTRIVHSNDLVDGGDAIHFDAASAALYGKRFAEAMLYLQHQ